MVRRHAEPRRLGSIRLTALALATALLALPRPSIAAPTVHTGTGDLAAVIALFQAALGDPNNGSALGPLAGGRRQINWDAGIVPFDMPGDFFNVTVTRGAEFTTPVASELRVSNDGVDVEFDSINPTYPAQFTTFSAPRLFTPFDSNVVDVRFFVSGTDTPATVNGFGAIFTDVDLPDSTSIHFFDSADAHLATVFAPTDPQGLSFAGATFDVERIARVRITSGNTPIGPDDDPGSQVDIVVMDDFLYGEPLSRDAEFCLSPVPTNHCTVNGARDVACVGTNADDVINGSDGDDVIVAMGGNDRVRAKRGNDVVCAGEGDDNVSGGLGNDLLGGEDGDDRLRGDRGDDILVGGPGDDNLAGGAGDDGLFGSENDDRLRGDRGDDQLEGDTGDDELIGGKGTDTCSDPDLVTTRGCEP